MSKDELNLYAGYLIILLCIVGILFMAYKINKTWGDIRFRGMNTFYIIGIICGVFILISVVLSQLKDLGVFIN
jgi:hypothetical protein